MTWEDLLLRRRTLQFRPVSLIVLVAACSILLILAAKRLSSFPVHIPSQAETKPIQAALVEYASRYGHGPGVSSTIKATKLEGRGWIVQIIDRASAEPGGWRSINTFYVGSDSSCQWLSIDAWGAY